MINPQVLLFFRHCQPQGILTSKKESRIFMKKVIIQKREYLFISIPVSGTVSSFAEMVLCVFD